MRYNNYLKITDTQHYHIEDNIKAYKNFNDEQNATPKIIIDIPNGNDYTTPQMINSPEIMLKNTLDTIKRNIVLTFSAKTVEEGRQLYKEIKNKF